MHRPSRETALVRLEKGVYENLALDAPEDIRVNGVSCQGAVILVENAAILHILRQDLEADLRVYSSMGGIPEDLREAVWKNAIGANPPILTKVVTLVIIQRYTALAQYALKAYATRVQQEEPSYMGEM